MPANNLWLTRLCAGFYLQTGTDSPRCERAGGNLQPSRLGPVPIPSHRQAADSSNLPRWLTDRTLARTSLISVEDLKPN